MQLLICCFANIFYRRGSVSERITRLPKSRFDNHLVLYCKTTNITLNSSPECHHVSNSIQLRTQTHHLVCRNHILGIPLLQLCILLQFQSKQLSKLFLTNLSSIPNKSILQLQSKSSSSPTNCFSCVASISESRDWSSSDSDSSNKSLNELSSSESSLVSVSKSLSFSPSFFVDSSSSSSLYT